MKTNLLFTGLFIAGLTTTAQISVTSSLPLANTMDRTAICSNGSVVIDTSIKGANKVWDFSTLTAAEYDTTFFLDPSDGPYKGDSAFPAAVVASTDDDTTFNYYRSGSAKIEEFGHYHSNDTTFTAWNPAIMYRPNALTYGQTIFDTATSVTTSSYSGFPLRATVNITQIIHCDSWGELTLPNGTQNTLRSQIFVQIYSTVEIDTGAGWMPIMNDLDTMVNYAWLNAAGDILLHVTTESDTITEVYYFMGNSAHTYELPVSIASSSNSSSLCNVYPNPSSGMVNVTVTDNGKIELFDLTGKVLTADKLMKGNNVVNIANFTAGEIIYVITIGSKVNSGRLIKQ